VNVIVTIVAFYTNKVLNRLERSLILVRQVVKVHTDLHELLLVVFVTLINVVNVIVVKAVVSLMMVNHHLLLMVHSAILITPAEAEAALSRALATHSNVVNVIAVIHADFHMEVVLIVDFLLQLQNLVLVTHSNVVNVIAVIHADFHMKLAEMYRLHSQVDQNHVSNFKRETVREVIHANIPIP